MAIKLTKREKVFATKVQEGKTYSLDQALDLIKACSTAKFKESVDLSINLGIDAKKSDQNVRGSTVLPHGNGKSVRVAVFTQGAKAAEATAAGADAVGMDDLAAAMKGGDLNYQVVIASPDAMRVVGQLGQVLGPRGLMPNPKTGTVTPNVAEAVKNAKAGMAKFRTDKAGIVHCSVGSANFDKDKLQDNLLAVVRDIRKQKPSSSKGVYIKKVTLSTTMGPGIRVDVSSLPE
ncbi:MULTISPECIES: 50S ribosomal protein L1 [Hydrocarboniphaga]|jgi:large subunit ribosomal protein L1|uniref:Large ribosomal subunit protein uL1 n=1 Tax=Hydrocarboniphaga effusa AP103 TaxID=1172194 RepID=I7ZJ66_9GAMM|nr:MULTISPECIES: 50S ribosomal protein L1 [Hydrocarboniphaga]EIT71944.1 50S ribosomal protein L1 [Hydrocarboniphaga effusa AP103]MDZ4081062.1 50S ribosomal protein L1 [Hydrocarboniphaga sp.]